MTILYPTSDLIGADTQISDNGSGLAYNDDDYLIIGQDIDVVSLNTNAIRVSDPGATSFRALVEGSVHGNLDGIFADVNGTQSFSIEVSIADTGRLTAGESALVVGSNDTPFSGSSIAVYNAGFVSGTRGSYLFGSESANFTNTGGMYATTDGTFFNSAVTVIDVIRAQVTNTGIISNVAGTGLTLDDFLTFQYDDIAAVTFVDGESFDLRNSGEIAGPVLAIYSNATVSEDIGNTGTIAGSVYLSNNSGVQSTVINTGVIGGDVFLNGGADVYQGLGDGLVTGVVTGGAGTDFLRGGALTDVFDGGDDSDIVNGRGGDDIVSGGGGADVVRGGSGDDEVYGGSGNDNMRGGAGNDEMYGGDENDTMRGDDGDDEIFGDLGNDILRGGAGSNVLDGGLGRDRMFGDSGEDIFIWRDASESTVGSQRDIVRDFVSGQDALDIRLAAVGVVDFLGTGAFTGTGGGEARVVEIATGSLVNIDTNGDGTEDMQFFVDTFGLVADDFLL